MADAEQGDRDQRAHPTFWEAFLYWLKLGFINFGGPAGQIAIMHRDLVEKKRWLSEGRFLHALNYCMLLPGPEAQQLAIYVGWLLHGTLGGIVAGVFFVLPSLFLLLLLSWLYVAHGTIPLVASIFWGLTAVILGVVAHAVISIGKRALKTPLMIAIAGGAFIGLFFFRIPFPLVILAAAAIGILGYRFVPHLFTVATSTTGPPEPASVVGDEALTTRHTAPNLRHALHVLCVGGALWVIPFIAIVTLRGPGDVFTRESLFFTKLALVTFGGAYAVLAYMAQQAVESYHWLTTNEMIAGLGLAESTPGPLIMVTTFVGFLAGYHDPGGLNPVVSGIIGGLVATYFTFLFSFLLIFLGAPHIERLRGNKPLAAALGAITAAVVGVVLNLAVFFAQHATLTPEGIAWPTVVLALASFLVLTLFEISVLPVILAGALLGASFQLIRMWASAG